jgi:hypothetical protein
MSDEFGEWPAISKFFAWFVRFLLSKGGAVYLAAMTILVATTRHETWDNIWVIAFSAPLLVIGIHFIAMLALTVAAAVGDVFAQWAVEKLYGDKLSPTNILHRVTYFVMSCVGLLIGLFVSQIGDMP